MSDETDGSGDGRIDMSERHPNNVEQAVLDNKNILPNIQQARASLKSSQSRQPEMKSGSNENIHNDHRHHYNDHHLQQQRPHEQVQYEQQVYEDMAGMHSGTTKKPSTATTTLIPAVNDSRNRAITTTGYEDMTGPFVSKHGEENETDHLSTATTTAASSSPPRLPTKEQLPQLPLKRCNTAPQQKSPPPVEGIQQFKASLKQTRNASRVTYENHDLQQLEVTRTNSLESSKFIVHGSDTIIHFNTIQFFV